MDLIVYYSLIQHVSNVISAHEDSKLLNNKSNERVLYLRLSSYFVESRLAIHIQCTYSSEFHIGSVALTNSS